MHKVIWSNWESRYIVRPVEYCMGGEALFTGTVQECEAFIAGNPAW